MIELRDVSKGYGQIQILKSINLTIDRGEKIAIVGQSGCGKSTLLRIIAGLVSPTSGDVLIDGESLVHSSPKELKKIKNQIAFVFQYSALFDSMNVFDNVAFSLVESKGKRLSMSEINRVVQEKLKLVEMEGSDKKMPSELSGGQKKRIGLARALVSNPKIILYDEPTAGLDPVLSLNIEDLIVDLSVRLAVTSITVTHQISTIMRASDKIYYVHEGQLLPPETPSTIRTSSNDIVRNFIAEER